MPITPSRAARLPREEFSSRKFRTFRTPFFSVRLKKSEAQRGRLGVVAGKAAAKTATGRNFLKRQARASLSGAIAAGNDMLVIFSPDAGRLTRKRLRAELLDAAKKAQQ